MRSSDLGRWGRAVATLALVVLATYGLDALACPVCGQAKNEQVNATYVAMTVFMSLTPLGLIFGVAAYVVRGIRKAEREQSQQPSETR